MNFTYKNHLTYKIGNRLFGYRETPYEKYSVSTGKVDPAQYAKSNWLEEQYRTADLIYKDYGKDFVVFFSGGTDSEIVLRAFKKIGINPRAVFIKFKNDYNLDDAKEAQDAANELGIKLETIEFDVKEFYKSGEAAEFAREIDCTQITYLQVYYHIKKLGFPAVMGGEQLLKRHVSIHNDEYYWYHCFRENEDASAMRFSLKYNIPLVNEWFSYTPEMMLYYLEDPSVQQLVNDRYNYKITSVSSKNEILKKLFPEVRNKIKTHGFERLLGFNQEVYNVLRGEIIPRKEYSLDGIPIPQLIRDLKGDL